LNVTKAAELLGFVDTPRDDVALNDVGRAFLKSGIPERKRMFRAQIERLRIFVDIVDSMRKAERLGLDQDFVLSGVGRHLPYENSERIFRTLVNWARYAALFDYDAERKKLFLDEPAAGASAGAAAG